MENTKTQRAQNHVLHMDNRKHLEITGVNRVAAFNEHMVVLHTTMGVLQLKGSEMKVNKLNVDSGELSVEGQFTSLVYTGNQDVAAKKSLLAKLLK